MDNFTEIIITTDEQSDFALQHGHHYFIDFDISLMPVELRGLLSMDSFIYKFSKQMEDRGHPVSNVRATVPAPGHIRLYFTPGNPLPLLIIIAIALGIFAIGLGAAAGTYGVFEALGEVIVSPAAIVENVVQKAVENPIPVIAIMFALAIAFFGFMRK